MAANAWGMEVARIDRDVRSLSGHRFGLAGKFASGAGIRGESGRAGSNSPAVQLGGFLHTRKRRPGGGLEQTPAKSLDGWSAATSAGQGGSSGGIAGGEIGANWQTGNAVVGLQGDMQWSDQWAAPLTACGLGCSLNDRVRVPWLATFRARVGRTFDRVFVYGTGGFATLGTSGNLNAGDFGTTPNPVDLSTGSIDWTIGGGMEFALDQNVSAKIEYLYMPGNSPVGAPASLFESTVNDTIKNNIVRGGIDYRLPIGTW